MQQTQKKVNEKQQQISEKPSQSFSESKSKSPGTRNQGPKQTHPHIPNSHSHIHIHGAPSLYPYHPHGIRIKGAQQKASLRQILRSDKKMIKR